MRGEVLNSGCATCVARAGTSGGLHRAGWPLLFPELPKALPTTKNLFFF
ncbi:unnamed protein product [Gulo gulo]|uniref:Uncharacterized protein n=1 Tax=Gulo gulo TaxID=48420 RepID=A0A9X9Q9B2_GULGU|nr:unnamed protein product [Gulo gulo]